VTTLTTIARAAPGWRFRCRRPVHASYLAQRYWAHRAAGCGWRPGLALFVDRATVVLAPALADSAMRGSAQAQASRSRPRSYLRTRDRGIL
jgi:hypothetical protein